MNLFSSDFIQSNPFLMTAVATIVLSFLVMAKAELHRRQARGLMPAFSAPTTTHRGK